MKILQCNQGSAVAWGKLILPVGLYALLFVTLSLCYQAPIWAQPAPPGLADLKERWWEPLALQTNQAAPNNSGQVIASTPTNAKEDWTRIAFQSNALRNWEIYTMFVRNIETNITNNPADDIFPRLNTGATSVVFVSDRDGNDEIYTMEIDGSNLKRLTNSPGLDTLPVWSSDNQQIGFVSKRMGPANLFTMGADGSNPRQLTANQMDNTFPTWSPDGKQLAWVVINGSNRSLWIMNADGSQQHQILATLPLLQHPIWSPDGRMIAFDYDANNDGYNDIGMVNIDGSNLQLLAQNGPEQDLLMSSWYPSLSADTPVGLSTTETPNILVTLVQYTLSDHKIIAANPSVYLLILCCRLVSFELFYHDYEGFPDAKLADVWAPISNVKPLPRFARATTTRVEWSGTDIGPAGVANYNLQYRLGTSEQWQDWFRQVYGNIATFPGTAGSKTYFRSQAIDKAGNIEAWPANPEGDASTTFYTWDLTGKVSDNRGVPLANQPLQIEPSPLTEARTTLNGHYMARLSTSGVHTISTTLTVNMEGDVVRNLYRHSPDALVVTTSLSVGATCVGLCLPSNTSEAERNWNFRFGAGLRMVVDQNGNPHFLWAEPNSRTLYYQKRTADGFWQIPELVTTLDIGNQGFALGVDQQGVAHVVWDDWIIKASASVEEVIYYVQRDSSGLWSSPIIIGEGDSPTLYLDPKGGVHVIYRCDPCQGGIFYAERLPSGAWQTPIKLDEEQKQSDFALTIAPDGLLHLAWIGKINELDGRLGVFSQVRNPDGSWGANRLATHINMLGSGTLHFDEFGKLHLLWEELALSGQPHIGFITDELANGHWSTPMALAKFNDQPQQLLIDASGTQHFITAQGTYRYRTVNGDWSTATPAYDVGTNFTINQIAMDRQNLIHLIASNSAGGLSYLTSRSADQAKVWRYRKAVTVPPTMHRPTLSFLYQLLGVNRQSQSLFDITIQEATTMSLTAKSTQVFSATGFTPQQIGWFDLTPWAGQTVTVTFAVHQAAGEPYLRAKLDDITLGSWHTPVAHTVTPAQIEIGVAATLVLKGENFDAAPTIKLGETALNVRRLDENTLEADLPATFAPGIYDLWITNAGGQTFVQPSAVSIGKLLYLPLILN